MKKQDYKSKMPAGWRLGGVHCGIKKDKLQLDLALLVSEKPATAAGVFTTNQITAPCVQWCGKCVVSGDVRALVVNSGNANCCTGEHGTRDNEKVAAIVARELGFEPREVLVGSTGVIGERLPLGKIRSGIKVLARSVGNAGEANEDIVRSAARAIMTTDTRPKTAERTIMWRGQPVRLLALAKGAGMIEPRLGPPATAGTMRSRSAGSSHAGYAGSLRSGEHAATKHATFLCFIMTDARASRRLLQAILEDCVSTTFNHLTVDGQTSTNDMVIAMANGCSKAPSLDNTPPLASNFAQAMKDICVDITRQVASDGEGASVTVIINVIGTATVRDANFLARAVANSLLVKTAIYGKQNNYGRILQAIGCSHARVNEKNVTISYGSSKGTATVFRRGVPVPVNSKKIQKILSSKEVIINVSLGSGTGKCTYYTCDMTPRYVDINADYIS